VWDWAFSYFFYFFCKKYEKAQKKHKKEIRRFPDAWSCCNTTHTTLFTQTLLPTTCGLPTFHQLCHKNVPPQQLSFQCHTTCTPPPFCSLHCCAGLSPLLPCFCVHLTLDWPLTDSKSGQWALLIIILLQFVCSPLSCCPLPPQIVSCLVGILDIAGR